ncbi:MAG: head-tail adaptor protein [Rhodobacteraceae bacterium]|uniref:Phage tail protein n=1 Tax=Thioclava marina TaxID=1915077 RepID=A0ABX3MMZ4_9RHOB|nr:head-tail adaptor protein [Thioclava marina]OOY12615.1 phage tail protein [Thioclava marina]TNF13517.1 MAG: head-tail adaptor protein [Paracoccaceae bacterium]
MSVPDLNRKLVLEAPERVADGAGGFTEIWTALGELWAQMVPGTGVERAGEFVTLASVPWKITVRAAPEGSPRRPRPEQRFREGGRVFRILAVAEADRGAHYLTCFAREEVVA